MRVLVVGAGGQVASAVIAAAPPQHPVFAKTHAELDIRDETAVARALAQTGASWLVNAAAYTSVDLAEDEPAQAMAINDTAVGTLAAAALKTGSRLLHLSTDFVFDGVSNRAYLPDDRTNPLSVYGKSKLGGERRVLSSTSGSGATGGIVLRTAWVYSAGGRNFVLTMLRLLHERQEASVVCDQIGTPTWARGVGAAIWGLLESNAPGGVYHWTDLGVASWYDFAVAIQDEALARGILTRAVPITPIVSNAYPTRARRPAFSALDASATRALIRIPGRHWRHNLGAMLDDLRTP